MAFPVPTVLPSLLGLALLLLPSHASAVTMATDPNGFEGIPWGATFADSPDLAIVDSGARIKGYELKQGPPPLGRASVDSMRFLTIDGHFARIAIRYRGAATHERVLAYLQSTFGPLDRTPGQLAGGPVQQLNWRGPDTEINLT